jgi:CheY-like chemotaxis protein
MKAGNRASEMTQRLLGFSRKQVFEPKVLNINDVVSEVSKMLPQLLGAHIDFSLDLDPRAGNVSADPIQLEGMVKRSGGYILVSSAVGIGTTMQVYLPQVKSEANAGAPEIKSSEEIHGAGTVLIAEDEAALRELISNRMRTEGYEVLEAANGEEAVAIASRHKSDIRLLLTDVIMPKLRGPQLASRLRLKFPGLKVIYMSGYTESALVQDGMLERNTVLLQKPFTVKKILEVIQQMNVSARS